MQLSALRDASIVLALVGCAISSASIAWSQQATPAFVDLPTLGEIQWEAPCPAIPHIKPGPGGGISGMVMVPFEGKIIMAGGFIPAGDENGERTSQWVHEYDPQTRKWRRLSDMPIRREYVRGVVSGDAIYVMGGGCILRGQDPGYAVFADCIKLVRDGDDLKAEPCGKLTDARSHMAVGAVGPYIVVVGGNHYDVSEKGYSKNTLRATTDVFDTRKPDEGWREATPIPGAPRGWTASAVVGDLLYVFGGLTIKDGKRISLSEAWAYDPAKDEWTRLPDTPYDVQGWEAAPYQDRYIILVGGVSRSGGPKKKGEFWNTNVIAYDTKSKRYFRVEGEIPYGGVLNDCGICFIGDTIYVAGAEGPKGTHFNWLRVGKLTIK